MPDYLQGVDEVPDGEYEAEYIDPRYYSPFAIRWAEKAHEYIRDGYHLKPEDGELLCRIDAVRACVLPPYMKASELQPSKTALRQIRTADECREMWHAMWEEWERRYQKWLGEQSRKWWAKNRDAKPGAFSPYSRYTEGDPIDDDFDLTPLRAYKDMRMREAGMSDDAVDKEIVRLEDQHEAVFGMKATLRWKASVRREDPPDDEDEEGD
ncbi:hypothetical protein [Pseudoxanthomonas sp.]|jgi:hypothetical protein|uniref:hypothetical protein n=1 Tax=Pseudoxanthomonas sp. TaxID=1871049 RepID=UPI002FE102B0